MTDAEFDEIARQLLEASHIWFNGRLHMMLERLIDEARESRECAERLERIYGPSGE